jgi:hypothetical protein
LSFLTITENEWNPIRKTGKRLKSTSRVETTMKKISEYLPLITVCTVLIGFLNIYNYYKYFGIEIFNYLDASEIIFSFSSLIFSIILVVPTLLISIIIGAINIEASKRQDREFTTLKIDEDQFTLMDVILLIAKWGYENYLLIPVLVFFPIYIYDLITNKEAQSKMTEGMSLAYGAASLMFIYKVFKVIIFDPLNKSLLSDRVKQKFPTFDTIRFLRNSFLLIGFIMFLFIRNYIRYKNLKNGYSKFEVSLLNNTDNIVVATNDSLYFIGATRGYYIFNNIRSGTNLIIDASDIRTANIKEVREGI